MMDGEGEDRIRATYHTSYQKLAQIKAKYDPSNFFRVNQISGRTLARRAQCDQAISRLNVLNCIIGDLPRSMSCRARWSSKFSRSALG